MSRVTACRLIALLMFSFATAADASLRVEIAGLSEAMANNARAFLSVSKVSGRLSDDAPLLSEFAVNRLHDKAPDEIREALMPFGYYSPGIETSLTRNDSGWLARYDVDPGPPTLIETIDLRIDEEVHRRLGVDQLLGTTTIKPGAVLSHAAYGALKQALIRRALSAGYLDVKFDLAEIRVHRESQQANILLHLNAGQQFEFGEITLVQEAVDQSFAERFIRVQPGEPFSTEKLINVQFALSDSGYFQNVVVKAPRGGAEGVRIPVVITAQSRNAQRFTARLGIGTDTGPRVRLGTEFRRLSGRGTKFRSDVQLSTIRSVANAQYSIPIKNVATDRQTFSGRFERAEFGDTDSDLYSLGARRYDRWKGLGRQIYLEYENELFSLDGDGENDTRSELLIAGASLAFQRVDDALFTRKGMTARLDVHGAYEGAMSDTSFLQATLSTRAIYPLGERVRLLVRSDLGFTEVENLSQLPPSQRFFTGGDRTVRGYGFQELSPENASGQDIGGRFLIAASVEGDYFFNEKYGVAAFFDHGNAVNNVQDALKSSAGLGFRYRTPIGVLRLDVAHPFDQNEDDVRLHLSLGPDT